MGHPHVPVPSYLEVVLKLPHRKVTPFPVAYGRF